MKRFAGISLLAFSLAFAIDYSDRSTQELLAALKTGGDNLPVILHELKKREVTMSPQEKKRYEEILKKLKHGSKK
ncbi:hypothetical protein [Hydrogenimonas cancrithermarum]|uniref:Uncharacterized protein n=1 Tax=Hydrogenimonas cancrithermarum TaxID=2993563 RepID=A0ABM8FMV3_9BACT|nr:hypothetical protein [Hydrogenimonas cancrithermarum]BDY13619.1 hypothetical protein HCR_19310 [Hydrogenimonas cancrithermarum]